MPWTYRKTGSSPRRHLDGVAVDVLLAVLGMVLVVELFLLLFK